MMVVVDQRVIHTDHATLHIHIPPTQAGNLSYTHAGIRHDIENRIPVSVSRRLQQEFEEKLLLRKCKCFSLLHLMSMCHTKLLQHSISWILADIVIIHCHLKYLVEHIMNVIYSRNAQDLIIYQTIVEALDVRFLNLYHPLLSEGGHDKHLIHINVVLKRAVLYTTLQLSPKLKAVIHR